MNLTFLTRCLLITFLVAARTKTVSAEAYTMFQAVLQFYRNGLNLPPGVVKEPAKIYPEYDFIVVGAGSGGSVVVNRLTENSRWTVLLLEAGKEEILMTDIPLLVSYIIHTDFDWGYKTEPSNEVYQGMTDNRIKWPRGKVMGGSSVLNYMVYSRGCKVDFDEWASLGNTGWSYEEVLPYFKKSEDIEDPILARSPYHGSGGYLRVSNPNWHSPASTTFLEAGREVGYDIVDQSDPVPIGFSYVLSTTKNGARLSASKAFLRPIRDRRNMHVLKEARVTKVLINSSTRRAVGVAFLKNRKKVIVRARKEVILSAGTLNTPQILMLSGIGPQDHLEELGIPVIQNSPVGYNLQDHVSANGLVFLVNDSISVVEDRFTKPRYMFDYMLRGAGPFTLPGGTEGIAFTLTKYSNNSRRPDMEIVFSPGALTGDTGGSLRKVLSISEGLFHEVYGPYVGRDAISLVPILLRPKSRGYIRLRSRNPLHWPMFYPNYYSDERDVWTIVEGIKQAIALSRTRAFQKYETRLLPAKVRQCEAYVFETDDYWACFVKVITTNLHHQVGTCRMGPDSDPETVVDPQLRVRGIQGLRVVDASVMPTIPSGHTNAAVFMIGEKASDMIKATWARSDAPRHVFYDSPDQNNYDGYHHQEQQPQNPGNIYQGQEFVGSPGESMNNGVPENLGAPPRTLNRGPIQFT